MCAPFTAIANNTKIYAAIMLIGRTPEASDQSQSWDSLVRKDYCILIATNVVFTEAKVCSGHKHGARYSKEQLQKFQ